jgi:predicted O-methyltransferase YrrM
MTNNYKINPNIPGWSSIDKLEMLAEFASQVPDDGWIVEVGSFCGRSAYAMGMNKKDSVTLTCFDLFPLHPHLTHSDFGDQTKPYWYDEFVSNTNEVINLEAVRILTPINCKYMSFSKKINLIFIDCVHSYEAVKSDIAFWRRFMADDGVIVFDDYFDMFPGCIQAVDEFIAEYNLASEIGPSCSMIVKLGKPA